MKNEIYVKSIVIGIVLLFIGASVVSTIADSFDEKTIFVVYNPTDDASVKEYEPTTNYGDGYLVVRNKYGSGGNPGYEDDLLIRFDLSGITSGSVVTSATLNLYYYDYPNANPSGRNLTIYRVTSDWDEDIVTWNTRPTYSTEVISSAIVPGSTDSWMSFDLTSSVQDFVNGIYTNYGWQIMDLTYWGSSGIPAPYFRQEEYGENMPYLEIATQSLENLSYFRVINLNNAINNYQILINVSKNSGGDVSCNGHCKDDFGDIRFLDVDNITFLDYWIEKKIDGSYAWFWVELPSDVETDEKIAIYYGDSDASSISDGDATFLWFDDFSTNTTGDWEKFEEDLEHAWLYYNKEFNTPLHSARIRSKVDCIDVNSGGWAGRIFQGMKVENTSDFNNNYSTFRHAYNSDDLGANETHPSTALRTQTTNPTAGSNIRIMSEGNNNYTTELLYSYPNNVLRGNIWDFSYDLLFNQSVSSNIPDNLTYIHFNLMDYHGDNGGGDSTGLFYDEIDEQLITYCQGSHDSDSDAWLELHYSWMFLGKYAEPEPHISSVGTEQPLEYIDADFSYTPIQPDTDKPVQFTDLSYDYDGYIVSWNWDFGDNYASTVQNPIHQYFIEGEYNVTLTVTDNDSLTDNITKTITVLPYEGLFIDINTNWNNIGIQTDEPITLEELEIIYDETTYNWSEATEPGTLLVDPVIFLWNSSIQTYAYIIDPESVLESGNGYWLYAYEDCILRL